MNVTLLTEKEVAKAIGLSVHWLRQRRYHGGAVTIPHVKIGKAVLYRSTDVETFVRSTEPQVTPRRSRARRATA